MEGGGGGICAPRAVYGIPPENIDVTLMSN